MNFIRSHGIKSFFTGRVKPEAKQCTACLETKPLQEFYFIKYRNNHTAQCKKCRAAHCKRRYWNEPGVREKISARGRANYQKLKNKHNEGWD